MNLRGYDPDQPLSAGYALAGFLHALGVPGQEIPPELDERASLYSEPAGSTADVDRVGQRGHRGAGPPAAAGLSVSPGGVDQPRCPDGIGRPPRLDHRLVQGRRLQRPGQRMATRVVFHSEASECG